MEIGDKLRRMRIQRGLTQGELADRCELSKSFISQVERPLAVSLSATRTFFIPRTARSFCASRIPS